MTQASYPSMVQALKSSRESIGQYEVIADGEVYRAANFVEASLLVGEHGGRLYRVVKDKEAPNGFRRVLESPLAPEIAKDIASRTPRKPEVLRCVPVFGR